MFYALYPKASFDLCREAAHSAVVLSPLLLYLTMVWLPANDPSLKFYCVMFGRVFEEEYTKWEMRLSVYNDSLEEALLHSITCATYPRNKSVSSFYWLY